MLSLREVSSPPKWCDAPPPPWYLVSHRHSCAIPHLATYRAIIVRYPIKQARKILVAILSLQVSYRARYEKYRCWASKVVCAAYDSVAWRQHAIRFHSTGRGSLGADLSGLVAIGSAMVACGFAIWGLCATLCRGRLGLPLWNRGGLRPAILISESLGVHKILVRKIRFYPPPPPKGP